MCGIFGALLRDPALASPSIDAALHAIRHRGPDDEGRFDAHRGDLRVHLAMRRLSIIDVDGGRQPIASPDGRLVIVFNGEIYNYRELRRELELGGRVFLTRTDTEVALAAYETWGPSSLTRLNGMFAFAIWDDRDGTLFVARDRLGEKPLYILDDGKRFLFASEMKSILSDPSVPREVDPRGLVNYLAFGHAIAPLTILAGIEKLPAAHYLVVDARGSRCVRWWDAADEARQLDDVPLDDERALEERIRALLEEAVRIRLVADVPVGAFLSGGIDSSAIVAFMARHTTSRPRTFSIGFSAEGGYDETPEAARVARELGTEHHELVLSDVDMPATLERLVRACDEPFADPAGFPLLLLAEFARRHVKVALTGDGGDELFGGYRRYAVEQLGLAWGLLPPHLRDDTIPDLVGRLPRARRLKRTAETLRIRDPARRYLGWLEVFPDDLRAGLLAASPAASTSWDPGASMRAWYPRLGPPLAADHLNRLMYVDLQSWLVDTYMEKSDKATMAASLEARLPFLDHRLVALSLRIPSHLKVRGTTTKRILRRALRGCVPDHVLRRKKHGFDVPTDPWLRGSLKTWTFDVLLGGGPSPFVDRVVVEQLWREHVSGRHVHDERLWTLLNLELWRRHVLHGAPTG